MNKLEKLARRVFNKEKDECPFLRMYHCSVLENQGRYCTFTNDYENCHFYQTNKEGLIKNE